MVWINKQDGSLALKGDYGEDGVHCLLFVVADIEEALTPNYESVGIRYMTKVDCEVMDRSIENELRGE
jgi:hypothetical protein